MSLVRRDFLRMALLAALARPAGAFAATDRFEGPLGDDVVLNRLTFGATDADRAALARLGRAAWLEDQLSRPAEEADLRARLGALRLRIAYEAGDGEEGRWEARDELRPLAALDADPADLLPLLDWATPMDWSERVRPADEVIAASLPRAVHAGAQLREVMTQFWHDHFNVHSQKDEVVAVHFPSHDRALREQALGNFRALLGAVATSPSMLVYLNNDWSRASPANENFARELLELHTLGAEAYLNDRYPRWDMVPKGNDGVALGYIDEDVYEVARAFTGWTIGDGREVAEGEQTPRTGRFAYFEGWHDPYQKRVLGRDFPPNRAALADGEEVLDLLAAHPATARHVCAKIARRLLADDPDPALVDRLAAEFLRQRDAHDQIAQVIRALVADPAFEAPPSKIRRPFELLAALYRATGVEVASPENTFVWQLARAGWQQHTHAAPDGHPDRTEDWVGGAVLLRLVDYAVAAHEDWFGCTTTRLSERLPPDLRTLRDLSAFWAGRLRGPGAAPAPEVWELVGAAPDDPIPEDEAGRHDLSMVAVAMAAISPRFLFR